MPALTTAAEYAAVREAIQKLTTLDEAGNRRDVVTVNASGLNISYAATSMVQLQAREIELARRLSQRNIRKRTRPDFTG